MTCVGMRCPVAVIDVEKVTGEALMRGKAFAPLAGKVCLYHLKVGKHNIVNINKIIRACGRFIFSKNKYESITDNINVDLEWLTAENIVQSELCKMSHKMLNGIGPTYFHKYLSDSNVNYRSTRNIAYYEPSIMINNNIGKRSFKYRASVAWLNLPEYIKDKCKNMSVPMFKNAVKKCLLHDQNTRRMYELFEIIDVYDQIFPGYENFIMNFFFSL